MRIHMQNSYLFTWFVYFLIHNKYCLFVVFDHFKPRESVLFYEVINSTTTTRNGARTDLKYVLVFLAMFLWSCFVIFHF